MPNTSIDWKNIAGTAKEYAVILIGNKQYAVTVGSKIDCEKLDKDVASEFTADVLLLNSDGKVTVGKPVVAGYHAQVRILEHYRDKKVIIFKKNRRHLYQRRKGHRQNYTTVEVVEIKKGKE